MFCTVYKCEQLHKQKYRSFRNRNNESKWNCFFFHRRLKKPLKPKVILQVSTPGSKDSVPTPIPILGARICHQDILIVHGNFIKPTFEKVVCTCYF